MNRLNQDWADRQWLRRQQRQQRQQKRIDIIMALAVMGCSLLGSLLILAAWS